MKFSSLRRTTNETLLEDQEDLTPWYLRSMQTKMRTGREGMIKTKLKTCAAKGCKVKFEQFNSLHCSCSPKCAISIVREKNEKKDKEIRQGARKQLESLLPASHWTKKAQAAMNTYIRARDYGQPCICCGSEMNWHKMGGAVDASHLRGTGAAPHLRFNCYNIHAGCVKCNRFLSGNITAYRVRLVEKIGVERVERLENDNGVRKFSIDYLKRLAKIFNRRARLTKKRRGIA
jgi:hypothetical protein